MSTTDWTDETVDYSTSKVIQKIWGVRYIHELVAVLMANNYDPSSSESGTDTGPLFNSFRYAMTDRNFSVIGLGFEETTTLSQELLGDAVRIRYSPYGEAEERLVGDVNGDGVVNNFVDSLALPVTPPSGYNASDPQYQAEYDLDGDGLNLGDGSVVGTAPRNTAVSELGERLGNSVGYAGYVYDRDAQMYVVWNRWCDREVGRWASRDPLGYVDGQSVYEYVNSMPLASSDYTGLAANDIHPPMRRYVPRPPTHPYRRYMPNLPNWVVPKKPVGKLRSGAAGLAGTAGAYIALQCIKASQVKKDREKSTKKPVERGPADCPPCQTRCLTRVTEIEHFMELDVNVHCFGYSIETPDQTLYTQVKRIEKYKCCKSCGSDTKEYPWKYEYDKGFDVEEDHWIPGLDTSGFSRPGKRKRTVQTPCN